MDRRTFIRNGLAAAAPLLAACSGRSAGGAPAATDERIVIVGAGIAGLAAAQELRFRGFDDVVILEARDRIGGRIWTVSIGDGIPVELGATWIHGITSNPVYDIAESNNISTATTDYDNAVIYDPEGEQTPPVDEELWRGYMRLARELPDASLQDVYDEFAVVHGLDEDERLLLRHTLNSMFEHEYGADISDLSIMTYDGGNALRGGDVVFPGGYSQIVDAVASGADVRLEHAVAGIDHSGDGVVVNVDSGSSFEADRVVVTVPLGVLKSGRISFVPPLPAQKQDSIDALGMGILNRTCLLFDDVFWNRNVEWIGRLSEETGHWSETLNLYPYQRQPVLAMFNAGAFGAAVEQYSDEELTRRAVEALRSVFGAVPEPADSVSTRWGSDPWTGGSYSYVPVGVTFDSYRELARPVGDRLFFAGEATHGRFPSTVHGALMSGWRAAREINGLAR